MKRILILCLLVMAISVPWPSADEGRIPIFRPNFSIAQPGNYILTRDIVVTAGEAIDILASDVTIDLNGHLISSSDPTNQLIAILQVQSAVVTIRNGRLSGGSVGVISNAKPGLRLRIENVDIEGTSGQGIYINLAQSVQMTGCRVSGAGGDPAIFLGAATGSFMTGQIVGNVITDVSGGGLGLTNFRGGVVRDNLVENFGTTLSFTYGILFDSSGVASDTLGGNLIEGNVVRRSDDDFGITIGAGPNNILTNNTFAGLGNTGISVFTAGNRLANNVSSGNSTGAVIGADHNVVERSTFASNTLFGVSVDGSFNLFDSNVINGNSKGLSFNNGTSNAYRGNMLRGNGAAVIGAATDAGGNIL